MGTAGVILMALQFIPPLGLSWRPYHTTDVRGAVCGQQSIWVVGGIYLTGFSIFWGSIMLACIRSSYVNTDVAVGFLFTVWLGWVLAHGLLHYLAVYKNPEREDYTKWMTAGHTLPADARKYLERRALPSVIVVMICFLILAPLTIYMNNFGYVEITGLGWMCMALGWLVTVRFRLCHLQDRAAELSAFILSAFSWFSGCAIVLWTLAVYDDGDT